MLRLFFDIGYTVVAPAFILMTLGLVLGRAFKLDIDTLNKLNLYAFVPSLIFIKFSVSEMSLPDLGRHGAFWILLTFTFWLMGEGGAIVLGLKRDRRPTFAVGTMFPNSANYGFPVAELGFGPGALAIQAVVVIFQNLLLFTAGTFLAAGGLRGGRRGILSVLRLPMIYAVILALVLRGHPDFMPLPIATALGYLGKCLVPVALMTLGAQMGATRIPRLTTEIAGASLIRLVLGPLAGWAWSRILGFEPGTAAILTAAASYPGAVNTVAIALEFKKHPDLATAIVFWSTVFSLFTVTVVLTLVRG